MSELQIDHRARSQTFSHHRRSRLGLKQMLNSGMRQRSGSTALMYPPKVSSRPPSKIISGNLSMSSSGTNQLARTRSKSTTEIFLENLRLRSGPTKSQQPGYLELVDPFPVLPPPYEWIAPGKPKAVFPCGPAAENPPSYSPCVYKIAPLMRKMEWVTPYQMAVQRHWRTCLVELNSTQLNIYEYDPDELFDTPAGNANEGSAHSIFSLRSGHRFRHRSRTRSFASEASSRSRASSVSTNNDVADSRNMANGGRYNVDDFRSALTKADDLERLELFRNRGIMNKDRLEHSYTLQYGKVGLAIDYKKRRYVLRFRLQTEQFLLQFPSAAMMIEWYTAISTGIDNSLDLNRRPMPKYRTVPRRRRRRRNQESEHLHYHSFENFLRGSSSDLSGMMSHFKHKIKGAVKSGTPMSRSSNSSSRRLDQEEQPEEESGIVNNDAETSEWLNSNEGSSGNISALRSRALTNHTIEEYDEYLNSAISNSREAPDDQGEDISSLRDILSSNSSENHDYLSAFEEVSESEVAELAAGDLLGSRSHQISEEALQDARQKSRNTRNTKLATGNDLVTKAVQIQPMLDIPLATDNSGTLIRTVISNASSLSSANIASPGLVSSTPTTSISSNILSPSNVKSTSQTQAEDNSNNIVISGFDMEEESIQYVDFGEKLRPCTSLLTFPTKRRQVKDAIRCMFPLLSTEKWTGHYLVKEANAAYKPETVWNMEYDPKKLDPRQLLTMERRYHECSFLQEYMVGQKDLIAKINYGFDDNRYCF